MQSVYLMLGGIVYYVLIFGANVVLELGVPCMGQSPRKNGYQKGAYCGGILEG